MLGGRDPVGVDRLDVVGVGLAAPADQEALGDRLGLVDRRAAAPTAGRARARTARRTRAPSPRTRARSMRACSSLMSSSWPMPHSGASIASAGLHVDARVAGADEQRVRLGGAQPGLERAVDEQAPDLPVRHRCRRGPRCRRRGSAARRPPCRARRSRWRRRRRPPGRTEPRSRADSMAIGSWSSHYRASRSSAPAAPRAAASRRRPRR